MYQKITNAITTMMPLCSLIGPSEELQKAAVSATLGVTQRFERYTTIMRQDQPQDHNQG